MILQFVYWHLIPHPILNSLQKPGSSRGFTHIWDRLEGVSCYGDGTNWRPTLHLGQYYIPIHSTKWWFYWLNPIFKQLTNVYLVLPVKSPWNHYASARMGAESTNFSCRGCSNGRIASRVLGGWQLGLWRIPLILVERWRSEVNLWIWTSFQVIWCKSYWIFQF